MEEQKKQIIQFVHEQKAKGYTVTSTLKDLGIKRPTYYSWLRPKDNNKKPNKVNELTPMRKSS